MISSKFDGALWLPWSLVPRLGVCVQNKLNTNLTVLRTFYHDIHLLTTAYSAYAVRLFLSQFPYIELMLLALSPICLWDQLRLGGGGGGGGCDLLPKYFIQCMPENQVVLPEYYLFFARKLPFWKNLGGLQPPSSPPPPPPRTPMSSPLFCVWIICYIFLVGQYNSVFDRLSMPA